MAVDRSGNCRVPSINGPARMQTPRPLPPRTRRRFDRPLLTLRDLLDVVDGRSGTRLELVCWDLDIEESRARPAWDLALRIKLLEAAGDDPLTGKAMYALSARGQRAVCELSPRRRRRRRPA
jgi:hypothetical protein